MADELTVARCKDRVRRALGWKRPTDWPAELPITEVCNEVGEWLCGARDWNFLVRPPRYLVITDGVGYIELPDDFTQILGVYAANEASYGIRPGDPMEVARMRANQVGAETSFVWCLSHGAPAADGPKAVVRLELGPIPAATNAQAFILAYKGGWVEVDDAADHIVLPTWVTSLYVRACALYVRGQEKEARGEVEDLLDRLVGSSLWQAVEARDDAMQQDLGYLRGGVGQTPMADNSEWPFPRFIGAVPIVG
jgi:hypothetical protein